MIIGDGPARIELLEDSRILIRYHHNATGRTYDFEGPVFEVDGVNHEAVLSGICAIGAPALLGNGNIEHVLQGDFAKDPELSLRLTFHISEESPVVRFRYCLRSAGTHRLTKTVGRDELTYISTSVSTSDATQVTEVRFSEFNETVHSFCLSELPVPKEYFESEFALMGPMVVTSDPSHSMLLAYEHGSQVPDAFINYRLSASGGVTMKAVKGNYYDGYLLRPNGSYESVWLQLGAVEGSIDELAHAYRAFVLSHMSQNAESRKPYIFYNTWAYQERNKHWNGKTFLDSMNEERILAEIDVAHRMGIEVFVLDTGWYEKTGDWCVSTKRFKDGLGKVRAKLDSYGMKLGLWFDPTVAAVSSKMLLEHESSLTSGSKTGDGWEIWETEASKSLCLASDYWDAFADELIRLVEEVGVTYFKWDAIGQYGCSDFLHYHGGAENSEQERSECYGFQIGIYMAKVVDKLCKVCPQAIVHFDITEGHRAVGLGFLSAGKYFLMNNGPYFGSFDIPFHGKGGFSNVFVYPGSARPRVCRTPLNFDKWIPSVLFLTHYLPDDPAESQNVNIASLILGQNGIWGDLLSISDEGIARFGRLLGLYKQVREDITRSSMVTYGSIGSSLEVREKVCEATGRGAISIFSETKGTYSYITQARVSSDFVCTEGASVRLLKSGKARIDAEFKGSDAKIVFFGVVG